MRGTDMQLYEMNLAKTNLTPAHCPTARVHCTYGMLG
eukprot:CAMPEP_0173095618 /NCGR_PEP_ID=MMETSP1102-20130122/32110_1 /TAXON_ID=49646 /ORGANISM="Geminigera sp., Strain Caron Lab Isolate" /LENGTH=36 /DNA_ID= /DNA_START= /DNA_END= /DNA_ORIENTATION=